MSTPPAAGLLGFPTLASERAPRSRPPAGERHSAGSLVTRSDRPSTQDPVWCLAPRARPDRVLGRDPSQSPRSCPGRPPTRQPGFGGIRIGMLAELAEYVIGLDTRPGAHFATAAAARSGAVDADATIAANPIATNARAVAGHHASGPREWEVESRGSLGTGWRRSCSSTASGGRGGRSPGAAGTTQRRQVRRTRRDPRRSRGAGTRASRPPAPARRAQSRRVLPLSRYRTPI